ncbi:serine/threonine-protein kinase MARK2-like isoform X2 [Cavia porcellus]|uniref:serine/threonine-protein kinase MARK2-like isoform X2 n=1 Tax=Cavia porcellus TaxID=10141 RepID=UPI000350DB44|nr:serine/threonine-protein kinase MARK2-like isoform X2 [Cavia porcellus]XP_013013417.1 serine/threonine-protein kinase MARK2-like isoform X2 [Cavia porcellus]
MSSSTGTFSEDYDMLLPLGEGHFAKVVLTEHVCTGMLVAVKVLQKEKLRPTAIIREVSILKDLQHPNIIKLLEVSENSTTMFLVMEYAPRKDLQQFIKRAETQKLGEERARLIFRELLEAVQYCHDSGVIHGDLKPANILMDREGHPKLSDFGFAFRFLPGQEVTACGCTLQYAAPELFLQKKYQGPPLDIWSLGVILYEMVAGVRPFSGPKTELMNNALNGRYQFPQHFSKEVQSLIKGLLNPDPSMRPTLEQVRQHPWLRLESVPCRPPQLLPKAKERAIVDFLDGKGYNPLKVIDAVKYRKYNRYMAPFLLLRGMALRKFHFGSEVKPTHKREAEHLFEQSTNKDDNLLSASPPPVAAPPARRVSEPCLFTGHFLPEVKPLGQQRKTVSLPTDISRTPPARTSCQPGPNFIGTSGQPGPASPIKSYHPEPATPKASRQPSPASPIKSYYTGPATPKASRQPSPASSIKSYHSGPATPKASRQPSPASSIKSYYTGPATPKASRQPSPASSMKSYYTGPATPKASRQPSPASSIKSYYTGPATPKASRQPSPASSIKSYDTGPATPKASRQPSPASSIKSYHSGPATPKASRQPSPASSIKSYYTGPATPKASRQPSPASSIKSYYTGPATPKASRQPSPASSIKSYYTGPATPKASRQPSPASSIKSYYTGPATPKASRQPSPASSIKSYDTGPATPKASRQPSPASSIKSYHSGPATPKASRQPSPAVPIKSCKTSRASTESYWQPNPASPGESFQHSPGTPNAAFTAAPAPVSSRRWGWKTVKRTMRDCLRALCCCPVSTCKCHKHKVVEVQIHDPSYGRGHPDSEVSHASGSHKNTNSPSAGCTPSQP